VKDNDNLTIERPTFVTHLECAMEGDHYPADQIHNLSKANKPLLVRYDLAGVKKALTKEALAQRPADMWRYREMLPVRKVSDIVSLGEVVTPLIRLPKLGRNLGGGGNPNIPQGGRISRAAGEQKETGRWRAEAHLRLPRISDRLAINGRVRHSCARLSYARVLPHCGDND